MRTRMPWLIGLLTLTAGGFLTWSLTRGQNPIAERSGDLVPATADRSQATNSSPAGSHESPALSPQPPTPKPELSKLSPLQQQMYASALRGADWLFRANRTDGRFVYGYLPALKAVMDGDHYLRQAGAAFALARAARFTADDRQTALARQAVLTLLADTAVDSQDPGVRHTTWPSVVVNRLAAAGLLVLAINELPAPADDLLKQSEELCGYIRRQQQADGSLRYVDHPTDGKPGGDDPDGINYYPGEAMYGLMLSQRYRPATWKTDMVREAAKYYRPWWQAHKNMAFVPWQTAACTEAYLRTKDTALANFVNEMNEWICALQYASLDPRHPLWGGGFMSWMDGKPVTSPPQVSSASYAEGLAEACRLARQAGDLNRFQRYREALERCLQFLTTLQYGEVNTQHFADWYRPTLLGGFHASHQDGDLRIDYSQHAVCALVQYLTYVADVP